MQTSHGSESDAGLHSFVENNEGDNSCFTIYPHQRSFVVENWKVAGTSDFSEVEYPRGFVNVWNDSTPEYEGRLKGMVDCLPWQRLIDHYFPIASGQADRLRGNFQVQFGFTCGQSHEVRNEENVSLHFGVAMPSQLSANEHDFVKELLVGLSKILVFLGVVWTDPDYLRSHPEAKERLDLFCGQLGPGICIETCTLLFIPVGDRTHIHRDLMNCDTWTEAMLIQRIIEDSQGR